MKLKRIFLLFLIIGLVVVYVLVFMIPDSADKLALIPEKVKVGEIWRMLTYQFTHLNEVHLIENMVGVVLAALLALELSVSTKKFALTYFTGGSIAILPLWFASPFIALGASAAIFAIFGFLSLAIKKINITPWWIVVFFIIITSASMAFNVKQGLAHLSGFVYGIMFFMLLKSIHAINSRKKIYCLRGLQ